MKKYPRLLQDPFLKNLLELKNQLLEQEESGERQNAPILLKLSEALDAFYFQAKLEVHTRMLSLQKILNSEAFGYNPSESILISEISEIVRTSSKVHPLTKIYEKLKMLFERQGHSDIWGHVLMQEIDKILDTNEEDFSSLQRLEVYSYLNNFYIKKLNLNSSFYAEKCFKYQNIMLELLFSNSTQEGFKLPISMFRNIIVAAFLIEDPHFFNNVQTFGIEPKSPKDSYLNAAEWSTQFTDHYKKYLSGDNPERVIALNYAIIAINQKDFKTAFKHLLPFTDVRKDFIDLSVKSFFLRIVYELNKANPKFLREHKIDLHKKLDSFRKNIDNYKKNKKLMGYQQQLYIQFYEIFRDLNKLDSKYTGVYKVHENPKFIKEKETLKSQISSLRSGHKEWFLEKLEQIK